MLLPLKVLLSCECNRLRLFPHHVIGLQVLEVVKALLGNAECDDAAVSGAAQRCLLGRALHFLLSIV